MQYSSILLIVVMIVAFYFLIIRPQRKRQQQQADMVKTLEVGTRVVTSTGIYATVAALGEKQVVLETSPGARITVLKQAVGRIVDESEEDGELAAYRAGAPGVVAGADGIGERSADPGESEYGTETGDEDGTDNAYGASGMAGGAPIQEYTPGSGPDFTEPGQAAPADTHQTSPWPAEGQDISGSAQNDSDDDSYGQTQSDQGPDGNRENGR